LLIEDWLVEPGLGRITRGGETHHLRPRLMDLLVYLADHAGHVVTKEEILDGVWHQQFVAESVLTRSVAELRHFLRDDVQRPRVIETIPKRGYRLVARVGKPSAATADGERRSPPGLSLVVLPFVDMTPARDLEYLCDGLAEEVTSRLSQLHALRVVARTSAFAFKGKANDVREIGRQLSVGRLLEGSVQRAADRVRVTVQLIDASDGCHIWSEHYDRPSDDIFGIEDDIAQALVRVLPVKLSTDAEERLSRRCNRSPAAHHLYLQGRHHAARRTPQELEQAIRFYEQAIGLDARYAPAHAGIAECCCVAGFLGYRRPVDVFPRGRHEAEQALAIDGDLAEAHAALGHELGMYEWHWKEAESRFVRALELNPGSSLTRIWYSHLLDVLGRFDDAIAQAERACECDPLAPAVQTALGVALYYAGRFERAEERCRAVLAVQPSFGIARFFLGRLCWAQGNFEGAADEFRALGNSFPAGLGYLASALRALGRDDEADQAYAELESASRTCYVSPLALAAGARDRDTWLPWLTRAFDEREGTIAFLARDPGIRFQADPAFRALLARLGLPESDT
jgi:TolB-like protein/Tfp pilus assembly protein PilF